MNVGTVIYDRGRMRAVSPVFFEDAHGGLSRWIAKIDTGFTGWIALPLRYIDMLGLQKAGTDIVRLADNQEHRIDVYFADIVWGAASYRVRVHQTGTMPLIGMSMLQGFVMTMDTRPGGIVSIEPAVGPN